MQAFLGGPAALGNIHTAFAFPIVHGDEVLGIIELSQ